MPCISLEHCKRSQPKSQCVHLIINGFYLLKTTQFNVGEIASRRGAKENTVYKMFKHLKKTYGLNIAITSAGYRGGSTNASPRRKSADNTPKTNSIEWPGEQETKQVQTPSRSKKSPRSRKETSKKREYSSSDLEEEAELQPSPSKKRFFYPVWISEEENGGDAEDSMITDDMSRAGLN